MTEIPKIILPKKSNAEHAKWWMDDLKQLSCEPIRKSNASRLRTILTELSKYVTVIGFGEDGELGIMNIELTVQDYLNTVESIERELN